MVIYPSDEKQSILEWKGYDQQTEEVDCELYDDFKLFLQDFFKLEMSEFWEKYDGSSLGSSDTTSKGKKD